MPRVLTKILPTVMVGTLRRRVRVTKGSLGGHHFPGPFRRHILTRAPKEVEIPNPCTRGCDGMFKICAVLKLATFQTLYPPDAGRFRGDPSSTILYSAQGQTLTILRSLTDASPLPVQRRRPGP